VSREPLNRHKLFELGLGPKLRRRVGDLLIRLGLYWVFEIPRCVPIRAEVDFLAFLIGIGMYKTVFGGLAV